MDTLMGSLSDIRLQFIQNKDIRFLYARYADAESFLDAAGCPTQPKAREDRILSCHEGHRYALRVAGGTVAAKDGGFLILSQEEEFTLFPENI